MGEILDIESLCRCDGGDVLDVLRVTSLERDFKIVVLPALSSPSTKILSSSFLFFLRFRKMPIRPP